MPNVVVYVPAKAWKALEERGLDPAKTIREFARRGYELTETLIEPDGSLLKPESESITIPPADTRLTVKDNQHFKPDFGKKLK